MEDYGFEYSDEEYAEEDVDIENQYYNSKGKNLTDLSRRRRQLISYSSSHFPFSILPQA
jgi:hypothetical protein